MEKKISFGFSKVSKKTNILQNKLINKDEKNKIELIKGLEGQSIQLVTEKAEEAPLVIPLKDNRKTSAALLSLKTRQAVLNGEEVPSQKEQEAQHTQTNDDQTEADDDTIEKRAAKELLAEVSKTQNIDGGDSKLVLPVKTDDLPLDGAKEPTIDDYESIPISQYGFAMLRGMGWKEVPKKEVKSIDEDLIVRPKGMGLGADKALKPKALLVPPEANEVLEIKKGAFIKVLGGKHKDLYGQIEGLDDHAGRVIVKMALGGTKESFNEFMVQVVSKKEYAQYSKCINSAKYDEYKRKENAQGQIIIKKEELIKKEEPIKKEEYERERNYRESSYDRKYEKSRSTPERNGSYHTSDRSGRRSRSRERRDDHQSSSTGNKKYSDRSSPRRDRHRSSDSDSTDSSPHRSKHKKSSKKKKSKKSKDQSRHRRRSASSSDEERRFKKKTKKSKRGRSRSKCRR